MALFPIRVAAFRTAGRSCRYCRKPLGRYKQRYCNGWCGARFRQVGHAQARGRRVTYVEVEGLPDGRMDTTQAARYLGVTVKTLAQWRWRGTGPAFCKPGRVYYFQEALDGWLAQHRSEETEAMSESSQDTSATVGWVLDHATSRRRLQIEVRQPGIVTLTVEVYGQQASVVELDDDGVVILRGLLGHALVRAQEGRGGVDG